MISQQNDPLSGPRATHRPLTYGEQAVGLNFNPSNDPTVQTCKQAFAAVIDFLHDLRLHTNSVDAREMYTTAIQAAQTSQMWGVKAITWPAVREVDTGQPRDLAREDWKRHG